MGYVCHGKFAYGVLRFCDIYGERFLLRFGSVYVDFIVYGIIPCIRRGRNGFAPLAVFAEFIHKRAFARRNRVYERLRRLVICKTAFRDGRSADVPYDIADIVFIGGSLIPHGGQNFIEPSRVRDAAIVGPYMHNFTDAVNRAKKADALIQVNDILELEEQVRSLLSNKELREAKKSLAYNWATKEAKVLTDIVEKVKGFI